MIPSTLADTVTTIMGSSQPVVSRGTADNLIPVYCSILAAVVVGLVAYIAFKRLGTKTAVWGHGRGFR